MRVRKVTPVIGVAAAAMALCLAGCAPTSDSQHALDLCTSEAHSADAFNQSKFGGGESIDKVLSVSMGDPSIQDKSTKMYYVSGTAKVTLTTASTASVAFICDTQNVDGEDYIAIYRWDVR